MKRVIDKAEKALQDRLFAGIEDVKMRDVKGIWKHTHV